MGERTSRVTPFAAVQCRFVLRGEAQRLDSFAALLSVQVEFRAEWAEDVAGSLLHRVHPSCILTCPR